MPNREDAIARPPNRVKRWIITVRFFGIQRTPQQLQARQPLTVSVTLVPAPKTEHSVEELRLPSRRAHVLEPIPNVDVAILHPRVGIRPVIPHEVAIGANLIDRLFEAIHLYLERCNLPHVAAEKRPVMQVQHSAHV